jgi:hypothetical protein
MATRKGFILITAAAAMIGLLAVVGLAVDAGRLYVVRGELQVFADETAIAAAFELDGTGAGVARARNAAVSGPGGGASPNRWNFATQPVTAAAAQFAAAPEGPYESNPASAAGLRFVKVQATGVVTLYFLALVPGIGGSRSVTAAAVAGQTPQTSVGDGLAPFSPSAHDPAGLNFGFTAGELYTLRWAPGGQRSKPGNTCPGDVGFKPGSADERGYVDVGQGAGADALRATVVNNSFFLPAPIAAGGTLTMYSGQQSVPSAVEQRFEQDSDVTAATFATYNGNGRRLLTVAVNGGGDPAVVVGFACFFLQPTPCGTKNTTPCCAEYVGSALLHGNHRAVGTSGLYAVQLIQ